ncbi:tyrosine-type recombinase/integrase [Microlunatus panaciterrae]|uniref:tyrosine-type recombinase/integrase n=1 Tax=Microlunatus panaciterrae TaxID=400768 RepID=UPI003084161A
MSLHDRGQLADQGFSQRSPTRPPDDARLGVPAHAENEGRLIHDLRHTAACLWLPRGVDPVTVQAWMGHASIATTNLYLHHLGTAADQAGLARLNALRHTGGTPGRLESK